VRDILKDYDGEVIRYFLLAGHYRSPIDFSRDLMEQSKNALARMYHAKENLEHLASKSDLEFTVEEGKALAALDAHREKFIRAMDEDLNTADAIAAIFELIADVNKRAREGVSGDYANGALALITELANVLGLLEEKEEEEGRGEDAAELASLIAERETARAEKNWGRADEIRDLLKARGVTLKDTPQGVQIIRE